MFQKHLACDTDNLGLSDDELAGLTGFTLPMVRMIAHLREAWLQADDGNARALLSGLHQMLVSGHSFGRNQRIVTKVLSAGLDQWQQTKLLTELGVLMFADYASARCAAITRAGRRCSGRWAISLACLFEHDPTTGLGVLGPNIVLCHRHRSWCDRVGDGATRFRIVHGWLGSSNHYGYGTSVFQSRVGMLAAKWWADRRRTVAFGESRKDAA